MSDLMYFNGLDGATGSYLLPPIEPEQLSAIIRGEPLDDEHLQELKDKYARQTQGHYAVQAGIDPKNLAETGWGIIFPYDIEPEIVEALKPLIEHRKAQAAASKEHYFKQYQGGDGYRPGENKNAWLLRQGTGPGPADPEKVPYYLLLVGDPERIPYRFQTQLDVQYAVGRIAFDHPEEYANYAKSVVEAETKDLKLARRAAFWGTANPDDPATNMSADQLIIPLMQDRKDDAEALNSGWQYDLACKEQATKAALAEFLGGAKTPALLFAAAHGMSFPNGDPRQFAHQGGLVCQNWPGPREWRKPIPEDFYFSASDLPSDASLWGLISFFFACYGGGTPRQDEFAQQAFKDQRAEIAPRSFISHLPQHMLSHPKGGALAVIGHVERAWGYSFVWGKAGRQLATFKSALKRLEEGSPVGHAFEFFNERYAELSTDLTSELEEVKYGKKPNELEIAGMWTANNDARNYVILGDPAVRMMVGSDSATPGTGRPTLSLAEIPDGAVSTTPASGEKSAPPSASELPAAPVASYEVREHSKEAQGNADDSAPQFAQKLRDFLSKVLDNAATLKVSTYVSSDLSQVKLENGEITGADLRALTYLKSDGETMACVPEQHSEADIELWNIHLEMVKQVQESRDRLIKSAVEAVSVRVVQEDEK